MTANTFVFSFMAMPHNPSASEVAMQVSCPSSIMHLNLQCHCFHDHHLTGCLGRNGLKELVSILSMSSSCKLTLNEHNVSEV